MSFTYAAERPEHAAEIERVLDRAFGPGRFVKTSERVRERGAVLEPALSRVALDGDGAVKGVCRISRIDVGGTPAYFLGPLAVDPGAQHHGLGATLTREAVNACRASRGAGAVVLVGAEAFFRPFGFAVVPQGRVLMPGPFDARRLLWLELRPGGLDGVTGMIRAPR